MILRNDLFDHLEVAAIVIFVVVVAAKAIYLKLAAGIDAIVVGKGSAGWALYFELGSFAGLAVWMIETLLSALRSRLHLIPVPPDAVLFDSFGSKTAGTMLIVFGLAFFIWAYISFGNSWRVGMDRTKPGELVTSGVFAISRNPIYLFIDLWFVGNFLITGRLSYLIFAILAIVAIHIQILREEKFLDDLYGDAYRRYVKQTGRYLIV